MSNTGVCCDDCFVDLAKKSTKAARLWLDLCEAQIVYGVFGLLSSDSNPSMLLLEKMGFLVTMDTRDLVIVKMLGKIDDSGALFFCRGSCEK